MTKCGIYWKKVQQFRKNDDFEGFCEWCHTDPKHMREEWQIGELIETMQISLDDVHKLSADSLRPLLAKGNEAIRPEVLKKVSSYLKNGNKLKKSKTEEFIARAQGVCKTANLPKPRIHECESPYCMMAVTDGKRFCSEKCEKEASTKKPRTETKKYDPLKPTWEERKALMHPKESKMDWTIFEGLQAKKELAEKGWRVVFQKEYVLLITRSDVTLENDRLKLELPVYLDGYIVHRKRESRDSYLRGLLFKKGHVEGRKLLSPLGLVYKDNSQKTQDEILMKVMEALQ